MRGPATAAVVVYGAFVGMYFVLRYVPAQNAIKELQVRLADREEELLKARLVDSRREALDQEAARLRAEIGKLEQILPAAGPFVPLGDTLAHVAERTSVRLGMIGRQTVVNREFYSEAKVEFEVTASVSALDALSEALVQRSALTRLSGLDGSVSGDGTFRGVAAASAYRYLPRSSVP